MKNKNISDSLVCSCTWNLKLSLFSVWIWIFHVMKVSAFDPPSPIWPTTVLERSTEPEYSLRSATSSAQVPPRELKIRFFGFVTTTAEPLNETTWNVAVALSNHHMTVWARFYVPWYVFLGLRNFSKITLIYVYPVIVGSTAGRYFHFPFWLQLWIKITSTRSPVDLRPPTESLDRELSESEEFCGWFMKRKKSYCAPSVVTNFPESRKSPNEYEPPQTQNRAIMW